MTPFLAAVCASLIVLGSSKPAMAASFTVSPATIETSYVGSIDLAVTGITTGQAVRFERFLDANANGTIDAADWLTQSFVVTDGQVATIASIRNTNVPGDEDGAANGQITTRFRYVATSEGNRVAAKYLFRAGAVGGTPAPLQAVLTVNQPVYNQHITGQIRVGANPAPHAVAVLIGGPEDSFLGGVVADANGRFSLNVPEGTYGVLAIKPGLVSDFSQLPQVTVGSGATVDQNVGMLAGTRTISGRVVNRVTGDGIPGVQITGEDYVADEGFMGFGFTDASGNFSLAVLPTPECALWVSDFDPAIMGVVSGEAFADTSLGDATNVRIDVEPVTALIYGTVRDGNNSPMANMSIEADDHHIDLETSAVSDELGRFVLGVTAGEWNVELDDYVLRARGLIAQSAWIPLSAGSVVQRDLFAKAVTAHLRGRIVDNNGVPIPNFDFYVCWSGQQGGGCIDSTSDGNGNFDVGVIGGSWFVGMNSDTLAEQRLLFSSLNLNVVDGVDQNNLRIELLRANTEITGTLKTESGSPISGIWISTYADLDGRFYNMSTTTDAAGAFRLPVASGQWQVNVDSFDLSQRGFSPIQSQTVTVPPAKAVSFVARQPTTFIRGRVVDPAGGAVANLETYAYGPNGQSVRIETDVAGAFSIGVSSGDWSLSVDSFDASSRGYMGPYLWLEVTEGVDINNVQVKLLSLTSNISATVKNSDGSPIANVGVNAWLDGPESYNAWATTDASGVAVLRVASGTWHVEVNRFDLSGLGLPAIPSQTVMVPPNASLTFQVPEADAHIRGIVVDDNGNPVGNVLLNASGENGFNQTQLDASGAFDFGLPQGTWNVSLESTGAMQRGVVSPNVSFTLVKGQDQNGVIITVRRVSASIRGEVKTTAGAPIANVYVFANAFVDGKSFQSSGKTDAAGVFAIPAFNAPWNVGVSSFDLENRGFQTPPNQDVTISGSDKTINFAVSQAGSGAVNVSITRAGGGGISVVVTSTGAGNVTLEAKNNVSDLQWAQLITIPMTGPGSFTFPDNLAQFLTHRFYRARMSP